MKQNSWCYYFFRIKIEILEIGLIRVRNKY